MAGPSLLLVLLVSTLVAADCSHQIPTPRVHTKLGSVVGVAREAEDGKKIYSFMGIPYIKPPIGKLRFKPPQPADPWTGDFSATNDDTVCIQTKANATIGKEDCVFLNVHTPWDTSASPPSKLHSVMVFIPGGAFIGGGSGSIVTGNPDYLLHNDIVLVTVNYRLGAMGFLSTGDEVASGNYGLLDQIEALKWVKNNIASFGGDPDEVTIFGESAGGTSLCLLMLSPLAKGLFVRAIAQSGSLLSIQDNNEAVRGKAQELAANVECPIEPSQRLIDCLRETDAAVVVNAIKVHPLQVAGLGPYLWSPRVDSENSNPLLPKHPIELMISGEYNKVPLLIGHNRNEGGNFLQLGEELLHMAADLFNNKWDSLCQRLLVMRENLIPEKRRSELCTKLRESYIDINKGFEENKMEYAELLGDAKFTSSVYKSAELMSRHGAVYSYSFNYESRNMSMMKVMSPKGEKVDGIVGHVDELLYLFKHPQTGWTRESPEYHMVHMMSHIWTDFAKTGEPFIPTLNAAWPKAGWPGHSYVVIDTQPSIQHNYKPEKMQLFDEVFNRAMRKTRLNSKHEL